MPHSADAARFRAIFFNAPIGYVITDRFGMIHDLNPEAERLFGTTREQVYLKPIFSIESEKDHTLRKLAIRAQSDKKTLFLESTLLGKNKIRFPAGIHIMAAPNPSKKDIDLHWMIRDLSLEKRAEEELRYQSRGKEILSDISRRFVSSSTTESPALFRYALEQIGPFVNADRCSLLFIAPDGTTIFQVYEWCRNPKYAIGDYLEGTGIEGFPWLFPKLLQEGMVTIESIEKLPEEARGIRQYWKNIRVKKAIVLPITIGQELAGAFFIEHMRNRKQWALASLPLLQTVAALFAGMEGRIRDEEELRISEEKFRTIFENFLNPVFIAGDDGRFTDANVAALDFMEQPMDDVANKRLTDWIPSLSSVLPEVQEDRLIKPRVIETEYVTHGRTKTMLLNLVPFPVRGRVLFYGIGQDITERKEAEKKIADARAFAEGIIEAVSHSLIVVTADSRVAFANQTFYQSFSLIPPEVEHLPFWEIQNERFNPPGLREQVDLLFATGKPLRRFEWNHRTQEGTEKSLELNAQLIRRRAPFGSMAVMIISDVTEQKRLEKAIRESEVRYQALFEDSPLPLWEEDYSNVKQFLSDLKNTGISDLRSHFADHPEDLQKAVGLIRIIDVNQATLVLHEAESKDSFLQHINRVFTSENQNVFCEEFLALDDGMKVFESEIPMRTESGKEKILAIRLSLTEGSEENWSRVIVSLMDITDRKLMEETLQKSRDLFQYIASFTQENPAPILEIREDGSIAFSNVATRLALRRRGLPEDPATFFPRDIKGILAELQKGNPGFFYREVAIGESEFGESIYLSPANRTLRLYAQDMTRRRQGE
jgi:PAS domain S-box-containing protein